ncbi:putative membrane transport protein [Desulfamplus magnetovallimortis]|uniref:Putative membrane transport protein n=1 Tax=Desulfamplus magnetovallimortis TaxID=1246637 RepID=A0A1W1H6V5_9BACT|nr:MFS transporter [Desulfamplus magnetovallimortis]SLM28197.1 putative membrane transport protein [Desulfamplus magnetovallimortis]
MYSIPINSMRVFIPFAMGYFLSYLYRVVNAVIAPDLVLDLNIDPSQLGLLTSTYFISFASSQLALGVLLDRYGPRLINASLLLIAATGAFVFARSHTLTGLVVGRALIGLGVSACLMAAFKAYVIWFPEKIWPRVNGFQMAAGGVGALTATTPVEWMLKITDWRGVFAGLAVLSLVIAAVLFFVVPQKKAMNNLPNDKDKQKHKKNESLKEQIAGIRVIFSSRNFWRAAPVTTLSQATFLSIQGLWIGPWLKDVAGLERHDIATILSLTAVAMITGFITLGMAAERLEQRGMDLLLVSITGMAVFMAVQVLIILDIVSGAMPWVLFGFFGTSGIIAYAGLSRKFPGYLSGRVTTGINLLVFVTAFVAQWAIGAIIKLWDMGGAAVHAPSVASAIKNGASQTAQNYYAASGYKAGFAIMLMLQLAAVIWYFISSKSTSYCFFRSSCIGLNQDAQDAQDLQDKNLEHPVNPGYPDSDKFKKCQKVQQGVDFENSKNPNF